MRSTFIKICGITQPADAKLAFNLGAGAIGLNFVAGPRKITPVIAAEILSALPKSCCVVALIHIPDSAAMVGLETILESPQITHLQVYGDCADVVRFGPVAAAMAKRKPFKIWPVLRISSLPDVFRIADDVAQIRWRPDGLVLDAFTPGALGGTGNRFDWNWLKTASIQGHLTGLPPMILAGGLNAENVADAIALVKPWGVDVSSGVEELGHPGIKNPERMARFVQAVRIADEDFIS